MKGSGKLKRVFLLVLLFFVMTSPVMAHDHDSDQHQQQRHEIQELKAKYYHRASNNEIYILPQDFHHTSTYVYFIKEFKGGFQKGQRLIGHMGLDDQYFLQVIETSDDSAIAVLEEGNPNSIQRYDRLLIAVYDRPSYLD